MRDIHYDDAASIVNNSRSDDAVIAATDAEDEDKNNANANANANNDNDNDNDAANANENHACMKDIWLVSSVDPIHCHHCHIHQEHANGHNHHNNDNNNDNNNNFIATVDGGVDWRMAEPLPADNNFVISVDCTYIPIAEPRHAAFDHYSHKHKIYPGSMGEMEIWMGVLADGSWVDSCEPVTVVADAGYLS
jgi:hypothetical protein